MPGNAAVDMLLCYARVFTSRGMTSFMMLKGHTRANMGAHADPYVFIWAGRY